MKFLTIKLILIVAILFSSTLYVQAREAKIRLMGKVKEHISKSITVKELEKDLKFVEEKVYNPYEKRTDLYGGVLLNDFVKKYANAAVVSLRFIAIDNYEITIGKKDWDSMRIILSTRTNRKYTSIQDKGPLRTIFPDYDPKERKYQKNISDWIWMIKKIEFK